MVIECPSCKTKFALDAQQLIGVESPRFHCSRCNHMFEISETQEKKETNSRNIKQQDNGISYSPKLNLQNNYSQNDPEDIHMDTTQAHFEPEQLDLLTDDNDNFTSKSLDVNQLIQSSSISTTQHLSSDDEFLPITNWPTSDGNKTYEVDLSRYKNTTHHQEIKGLQESLPFSNSTEQLDRPESLTITSKQPIVKPIQQATSDSSTHELEAKYLEEQKKFLFNNSQLNRKTSASSLTQPVISSEASYRTEKNKTYKTESLPPTNINEQEKKERLISISNTNVDASLNIFNKDKDKDIIKNNLDNNKPRLFTSLFTTSFNLDALKPLLLLWSIPFVLTLFFALWGSNIKNTPNAFRLLLNLEQENLPRLASPGLALVNLQSQIVSLDNGKKVIDISGELVNATLKTYSDVAIVAKLYDAQNQTLQEKIIHLNNAFQKAKIASLNEEQIEKMQNELSNIKIEIKPNKRLPFRLVFTSIKNEESFFSAKVYNVKW